MVLEEEHEQREIRQPRLPHKVVTEGWEMVEGYLPLAVAAVRQQLEQTAVLLLGQEEQGPQTLFQVQQ